MKNRIATFKDFVGELKVTYKRTKLPTVKIKSAEDVQEFMYPFFDEIMDDHEEVKVLHLNRSHHVVNIHHVSSGSDGASIVPIKDIIRQAILIKTFSIVLLHNHPSSNLKPSKADIQISNKLKKAAELFEIQLIDSVILTRESFTSLSHENLLE